MVFTFDRLCGGVSMAPNPLQTGSTSHELVGFTAEGLAGNSVSITRGSPSR